MINLNVKDYCHNCEFFKPHLDKEDYFYHDDYDNLAHHEITIYCKRRHLCDVLYEHLQKNSKEES